MSAKASSTVTLTMKIPSLVLYTSIATAIVGAFFAGQYMGRIDAEKLYARVVRVQTGAESTDSLYIAGAVADLLRDAKPSEALRVVEQYAQLRAPSVADCIAAPDCAWWAASSVERQTRIKGLVAKYGAPLEVHVPK